MAGGAAEGLALVLGGGAIIGWRKEKRKRRNARFNFFHTR